MASEPSSAAGQPSLGTLGHPETIDELLLRAAHRAPEATAFIDAHRRTSFGAFESEVERAADGLVAHGLHAGDRVAVSMGNYIEIITLFFAVMRVGGIWVGIPKGLARPEKEYLLADSGASMAFGDHDVIDEFRAIASSSAELRAVFFVDPANGGIEWTHPAAARAAATARRSPFEPALISYTSGTSGRPKGAVHSEHNLLLPATYLSGGDEFGNGARIGVCLSLTIANMMVMTPLISLQTEACVVLIDTLNPREIVRVTAAESIESMTLVPTTLYDLVENDSIDPADLRTLTRIQTGGASWSEQLVERFAAKFGTRAVGTYGLTEAPTCVALEPRDRRLAPGASGQLNKHLQVTIEGPDGVEVAHGMAGEICLGPARHGYWHDVFRPMLGYWRQPDASAATIRNGLVHTGDIGLIDDNGDLQIRGRTTDLFQRGGANVYPAEIELALSEHEAVASCAVVGMDDERLGSTVVAVVVLNAAVTDDELAAHCASRLARYKRPESYVRATELPRNSMGKVVRPAVRQLAAEALARTIEA